MKFGEKFTSRSKKQKIFDECCVILPKITNMKTLVQGDPFKISQTSGVAPCKRRF